MKMSRTYKKSLKIMFYNEKQFNLIHKKIFQKCDLIKLLLNLYKKIELKI